MKDKFSAMYLPSTVCWDCWIIS